MCAFRLLTMDLLVLYGVMNEGTINVLGNVNLYRVFGLMANVVYQNTILRCQNTMPREH